MRSLSDKNRSPFDRRARRSRAAIIGALNNLLLDGAIGEVTLNAVVNAAGISRSTFYLHFSNLDALIGTAITPLFNDLACASVDVGDLGRLQRILEHFGV